MTTLGEAFIEVHADCKPFARELAECVKAAIKAIDAKIDPQAMKLGEHMAEGVSKGFDKDSDKINRTFRKTGRKLENETKTWAQKLAAPFERMAKGNFILTRIFGQMVVATGKASAAIGRFGVKAIKTVAALTAFGAAIGSLSVASLKLAFGFSADFSKALSTVFTTAGEAVSAMLSFGSALLSMLPTIIATAGAVLLLVAAIAALVAILTVALAPFATLLGFLVTIPTLLTGALVTILPLVIALHGLTDALQVLQEKDPKKFAEGLKKLPPVMQILVGVLKPLLPLLKSFRDSIQAGFFGPILTQLQPFLKTVLPVLQVGFTLISQSLGNIVLQIMRLVSSRAALDGIAEIMGQVALFLDQNSGAITALIEALGKMAVAMLPTVLELFTKFTGFLTEFATWVEGAITDGRFQRWLDTAIESAKSIWGLIKALINLFKEMFSQTDEGGRKFLDKITAAINKFTTWLRSPDGMKALENAVAVANLFADALKLALSYTQFILTTFNKIADVIRWIRDNPILAPLVGAANLGGQKFGKKSFSGGGVVPRDEVAMVHKGEPILDPANSVARNRSILAEAGMLDMLSTGATVVNVYLGTERLDQRVDYRIGMNNRANASLLRTGPRGT